MHVLSFFHYSTASRDIVSGSLNKEKEFDSAAIMTICLSVVPSVVQWPLTTNSNRKLSNPPAPYALYNSRIIHILLQSQCRAGCPTSQVAKTLENQLEMPLSACVNSY